MRIVGGEARGRRLRGPPGRIARPTSDRVREALFDILGQRCDGWRVLDLYAGTGALGIEALSRGAASVTFVERDPRMLRIVRSNLRAVGYEARATVLRGDACVLGGIEGPFHLVLADPPYAVGPGPILEALATAATLIVPGARVVVEHGRRTQTGQAYGALVRSDTRRYGDTLLSFFEHTGGPPCGEPSTQAPSIR